MILLFEVEGKKPEQIREFAKVEATLKALDSSGPHSFACLTRQDGTYLQVAGGGTKCLIERHDHGENTHWRAFLLEPQGSTGEPQILTFGGGQMTLQPDELFSIDEVISLFQSFFASEPFPAKIKWREMTEMPLNH